METSLAVGLQRIALAYHFLADLFPDQTVRELKNNPSEIKSRTRHMAGCGS
jgi:hypothetical protein